MGKEALTSHGQRIASESPVIFFEQTFTGARLVFVKVANENFAAHGWILMGGANSRDPPLIHNCSADAMAHGSRRWRRCCGTRSQMVAQMERQKEKREREREKVGLGRWVLGRWD